MYGIAIYGMNICNATKPRMYGNGCMKLEIMVWMNGIAIKVLNECMVLQLRF